MEREKLQRAVDMVKELEDTAAHWERLLNERGPGNYASFNVGPEDAKRYREYVSLLAELVEQAWKYSELCK